MGARRMVRFCRNFCSPALTSVSFTGWVPYFLSPWTNVRAFLIQTIVVNPTGHLNAVFGRGSQCLFTKPLPFWPGMTFFSMSRQPRPRGGELKPLRLEDPQLSRGSRKYRDPVDVIFRGDTPFFIPSSPGFEFPFLNLIYSALTSSHFACLWSLLLAFTGTTFSNFKAFEPIIWGSITSQYTYICFRFSYKSMVFGVK